MGAGRIGCSVSNGSGQTLLMRIGTERVCITDIKIELGYDKVKVGLEGKRIHAGFMKYGFTVVGDGDNYEQTFDVSTASGSDMFVTILIQSTGEIICDNSIQANGTVHIVTKAQRYRPCYPGRHWQDCDGFYWTRRCTTCNVHDGQCRCPGQGGRNW